MNITALQESLNIHKISKTAYSFFGEGIGECYVLTKEGNEWKIYYSERGQRQGLQTFQTEHDACKSFERILLEDNTTRAD